MNNIVKVGLNTLLLLLLVGVVALPAVSSGIAHVNVGGTVLSSTTKRNEMTTRRSTTRIVKEPSTRKPMPKPTEISGSGAAGDVNKDDSVPQVKGIQQERKVILSNEVTQAPETSESTVGSQ